MSLPVPDASLRQRATTGARGRLDLAADLQTLLAHHPEWRQKGQACHHPLAGHCYLAAEVLYHAEPGVWKPMNLRHEGASHWWLRNRITGLDLDLTAAQFNTPVPYHLGRGRGFLTRTPSLRARVALLCLEGGT